MENKTFYGDGLITNHREIFHKYFYVGILRGPKLDQSMSRSQFYHAQSPSGGEFAFFFSTSVPFECPQTGRFTKMLK